MQELPIRTLDCWKFCGRQYRDSGAVNNGMGLLPPKFKFVDLQHLPFDFSGVTEQSLQLWESGQELPSLLPQLPLSL